MFTTKFKTSLHAYLMLNTSVGYKGNEVETRLGKAREIKSLSFTITNPTPKMVLRDEDLRIKTEYANTFWDFMISGGTNAEEVFKDYPNVAQFTQKPKSDVLPENFNTFYGPRILEQLPAILKELEDNPSTRRAVIKILDKSDNLLLGSDETLEYPCTDSVTFSIENGALCSHVHMRSQNTLVVFQLDLFLQTKLLEHVAGLLGLNMGSLSFSMVNAHMYEKDRKYFTSIINNYLGEL